MHGIACVEVHDNQATAGGGLFCRQRVIQRQALECLVVPCHGKTNHRIVTDKGHAAGITRAKSDGGEGAGLWVNGAKLARAAVEDIKHPVFEARGVRHG